MQDLSIVEIDVNDLTFRPFAGISDVNEYFPFVPFAEKKHVEVHPPFIPFENKFYEHVT